MDGTVSPELVARLEAKARWIWRQTLLIHKRAPDTRVASSLSPIEVFVCLFYGGLLKYDPLNPQWPARDRLVISKAHGAVCMYPILADVGFFSVSELDSICRHGSFLGAIPDPIVPGFETANGSLGHGLGVACGMALALDRKHIDSHVFVIVGDGELYEGAVWEAIMFAGHHKLDRLILIVDNNSRCMLNFSNKVIDLFPLKGKFTEFGWRVEEADGHAVEDLYGKLSTLKNEGRGRPSVLIANTIKGHGVPSLERDPVCHVKSLSSQEVDALLEKTQDEAHG